MFIIIGYIVVIASTLSAFVLAGGKPLSLFHLYELYLHALMVELLKSVSYTHLTLPTICSV